jgi:hypothetical protein
MILLKVLIIFIHYFLLRSKYKLKKNCTKDQGTFHPTCALKKKFTL